MLNCPAAAPLCGNIAAAAEQTHPRQVMSSSLSAADPCHFPGCGTADDGGLPKLVRVHHLHKDNVVRAIQAPQKQLSRRSSRCSRDRHSPARRLVGSHVLGLMRAVQAVSTLSLLQHKAKEHRAWFLGP